MALRRLAAVNILVQSAVVGTLISAPTRHRIKCSALFYIGAFVRAPYFARIISSDGVSPVRPGTECELADRCDPKIVTGEWCDAIRELFEVGARGCVGQADRWCPGVTAVDRLR